MGLPSCPGTCDPMLNFFMCRGFPVRLAAVAITLSCSFRKRGKAKAVSSGRMGATGPARGAPVLRQRRGHDGSVLSELEKQGRLQWVTHWGTVGSWLRAGGGTPRSGPASRPLALPDNSQEAAQGHSARPVTCSSNRPAADRGSQQSDRQEVEPDLPHPKNYWMASVS